MGTTGIYMITNLATDDIYIGQSKNIERRFIDHITPGHDTEEIDRDINKYGKSMFTFEILEECSIEELDDREAYYIDLYDATLFGYNKLRGGQQRGSRQGDNNGNAKLTEDDVYEIREAYKNHESRKETYQRYKHIVSESNFNSIWQGQFWTHIHMDVYTEENKNFYIGKILSDEEVIDMRTRYSQGESIDSICELYKDKATKSTVRHTIFGSRYKHLPVYKKTTDKWVNVNE